MTETGRLSRKRSWAGIGTIFLLAALLPGTLGAQAPAMVAKAPPPGKGDRASDFSLEAIDGALVRLSTETARGPVVLVVLRGWPGYQCPFCTRQFGEYIANATTIEAKGAHVLFVYPGPADGLKRHAEVFTKATPLPAGYRVLLDPDYTFTRAWGLRWDAPNETAYPSTFVLDRQGRVVFARTSHSHGDRVPVADVVEALAQLERR
jgi:thioredoxin-dependent peroxiredoxin